MTKTEFLSSLREKLTGLPPKDIDERINFYEEMINDRMDEGKTEEEAVADIGTVDEVVEEIAKDTPLVKLVKHKMTPKRRLRAWEVILMVLGLPLWLPLMIVASVLCFVGYVLIWILVIVTYAIEISLIASAIGAFVIFLVCLGHGQLNLILLGASIMCTGGAILMFFGCIGATKITLKLSKTIATGIKKSFIRKGE